MKAVKVLGLLAFHFYLWRSEDLCIRKSGRGRGNPAPTELLIGLFIILVAEILYLGVLFQVVKPLGIEIILFSA
jgi:hypothetical protein